MIPRISEIYSSGVPTCGGKCKSSVIFGVLRLILPQELFKGCFPCP